MSKLARGKASDFLLGAVAFPFIEAAVLLPLINLGKGLPQARPRRGTAVPLQLPVDVVHFT
jgi:hypothetical protein